MKILLTGSSGFLGSALALYWLKRGYNVGLLLRPNSRLHRLRGLETSFNISFYKNDDDIKRYVINFNPDVVVHTACNYGRQGETFLQLLDDNHRFGIIILQAMLKSQKQVFFINSGSSLTPLLSPYALSKRHFYESGQLISNISNGNLVFIQILLQHMFGPFDNESKFTTYVLRACQRNDLEIKLTKGEQYRDFIYIDDVIDAFDTVINHVNKFNKSIEIQVGSGNAISIRQFVETVHSLTNSQTKLAFGSLPYRENEPMHCSANIDEIMRFGWRPKFNLISGLKKTIEMELNK